MRRMLASMLWKTAEMKHITMHFNMKKAYKQMKSDDERNESENKNPNQKSY